MDEANILPPDEEAALERMLTDLEVKTGDQVVVVTLASLRGQEIEEYGVALGRHWGIGRAETDTGALLLVAPNERQVRIEVGYGLEGDLTDAMSKLIIESSILPRFRAGDYAGGIRRGVEDIVSVLEGNGRAFVERAPQRMESDDTWGAAATTLVFAFVMFVWLSGLRGGRRRGPVVVFGPGGGFSGRSGGGGSFGGGGASGRW